MATEAVEFEATARPRVGKGAARQVRREGKIPAIIYGDKKAPEAISLDYKDVWLQYLKGHFTSTVCTIKLDGKSHTVIPRDIQIDPVKDTPVHIDLLRIGKDGLIRVEIPVRFVNEHLSPGLKRGGALNIVRHGIEVWCPYDKIPSHFEVDLDGITIGTSIHISALTMPEGVKPTITDRDFTIATIVGRLKEEEPQEEEGGEAPATEEGAEPGEGEQT